MSELKPCPFCGGEAQVARTAAGYWAAYCEKPMCGRVGNFKTEAEAIEAWNSRAEMDYEDAMIFLDECGAKIEVKCEELGSVRIWQECYVWSHDLSCGHEVDTLDMEPPKFCPECGAKVVSE